MKPRQLGASMVAAAAMLFCAVASAATPSERGDAAPDGPVITRQQIEADWLRQGQVRGVVTAGGGGLQLKPEEDAAGACDGNKDGKWGFHTDLEDNPWWQVDLQSSISLDQVLIYNRCDNSMERASRLKVLLSEDGESWKQVYQHDGTIFYGFSDKKPLKVQLGGAKARYVRIQSPGKTFLHLDEVELYQGGTILYERNVALGKPATQCSTSRWSARAVPLISKATDHMTAEVVRLGLLLADNLRSLGVNVDPQVKVLGDVAGRLKLLPEDATDQLKQDLYLQARWASREMALANPLLDFDDILFVKRMPSTYNHMSDQYMGWWSQPGGGLYVLEDFKSDDAKLRLLSGDLPPGSIIRPDVDYDGKKVLFAYAKHYPKLRDEQNKLDKSNVPEDAFYHIHEVNLDGTGLRRLTRGKYDDFDARYLPGGEIVFLSTRRGQHVQCGKHSGMASIDGALPDCYVRCGGGPQRPVAVYTLHVMDGEGENLRQISPFENFEWTPSVAGDGRILYSRWDYVDRDNMPYMSLWSTMPDGTNAQAVFGNFTHKPHCVFEARSIPNSRKLIFTASGHHAMTGGSLVLLDTNKGVDGEAAMTRLTPEVPFPEIEGWAASYYLNPYPLSEEHYLVGWSDERLNREGNNDWRASIGVYLYDAFGNLNLIYRQPGISSMNPLPIRPRPRPHQVSSLVNWDGRQEGRMLLLDVYQGLSSIPRGTVRGLRIVGVPAKDHPTMNRPVMGLTRDDPGKFVIGTVPVEEDGSAYFRVPSGVSFFMQAVDEEGMAVQTMRTAVYVQPGQEHTCVGCHEQRNTAPPNSYPIAARRQPSKITPGPEGSWPLDFAAMVQPVMDKHCTSCHAPGKEDEKFDLTAEKSYDSLVDYGQPSLKSHVLTRYRQGYSIPGACAARTSPLMKLLARRHYEVNLTPDERDRLITWMDTYAQRLGSFSDDQNQRLRQLKARMAPMLAQ